MGPKMDTRHKIAAVSLALVAFAGLVLVVISTSTSPGYTSAYEMIGGFTLTLISLILLGYVVLVR